MENQRLLRHIFRTSRIKSQYFTGRLCSMPTEHKTLVRRRGADSVYINDFWFWCFPDVEFSTGFPIHTACAKDHHPVNFRRRNLLRETCSSLTTQRLRFNTMNVGKSQNFDHLWQTLPPRLKHIQVGMFENVISLLPAKRDLKSPKERCISTFDGMPQRRPRELACWFNIPFFYKELDHMVLCVWSITVTVHVHVVYYK